MAWNQSPQVAVARDAARKLGAEIGCVIIYVNEDTFGMASYGHDKQLCDVMGKLGDHLFAATKEFAETHLG